MQAVVQVVSGYAIATMIIILILLLYGKILEIEDGKNG